MKNISRVILLSTSCLIWYGADNVCASVNVFSGIPKSGTNTHDTIHLADDCPHLPHPRGVAGGELPRAQVRGGMFRTERSAMLTSYLPQAQSGNRHNLNTPPEVGGVRGGVTSEASIPNLHKDNLFGIHTLPIPPYLREGNNSDDLLKTASVCFITDTGECSGRGGGENPVDPVNPIPPQPSPSEACEEAGYELTSCPSLAHGENFCPVDSSYFKICVCDDNLKECHKPYYGVGPSCDGKYASCKRDDAKACKEDGYGQSGACPDLQTPNKKCPYDNAYYDKCVCRSDLVTCTYPQTGVGSSCNGKYASCQCPSSYKSCECGGAAGATSCTVNGQTTYASCKDCCEPTCRDEINCGNGYVTQDNGCGGTCRVCKKEVMIHCSDGTTVSDASMCKNTDGVEVDDGDFCIILSKYQGYGLGYIAMDSTPPGWKFASLEVMKKATKHIDSINKILNDMGEPNLYNDWYWTNTYWTTDYVYAINPYSGEITKTGNQGDAGVVSRAYHRYYKDCD